MMDLIWRYAPPHVPSRSNAFVLGKYELAKLATWSLPWQHDARQGEVTTVMLHMGTYIRHPYVSASPSVPFLPALVCL